MGELDVSCLRTFGLTLLTNGVGFLVKYGVGAEHSPDARRRQASSSAQKVSLLRITDGGSVKGLRLFIHGSLRPDNNHYALARLQPGRCGDTVIKNLLQEFQTNP